MISEKYGVMALVFEFWISVIVFIGGGALIWHDTGLVGQVFGVWGILLVFWFNRRQAEANSNNLLNAIQQPPAIIQPTVIPQQPTAIPIVEQPAQPNAPTGHTGQQGGNTNV